MSDDALWVQAERLSSGGFASYSLASNRRGLAVAGDADVVLQASNLILSGAAPATPSARSLRDITTIGVLDASQRRPVSLALSSDHLQATPLSAEEFPSDSLLSIQRGARIQGEPGSRIRLESNTSMRIDGLISAPAGEISALVNNDFNLADGLNGYVPQQSLWLGDQAHLSAAGIVRYLPNPLGLLEGDVLGAGSINLRAQRGYMATHPVPCSTCPVPRRPIDIRQAGVNGMDTFERRTVASRGGQLSLAAAEGIFLNSDVRARGGSDEMLGGSLLYALDAADRYGDFTSIPSLFPETARRIDLVADCRSHRIWVPTLPCLPIRRGRAMLSVQAIEAAGFDNLRIEPRSRVDNSLVEIPGELVLGDGVDLRMRGSLAIDAAIIGSSGGTARLSAPVISLGQRSPILQEVPAAVSEGDGRATFAADFIDVIGHSVMQGFSNVSCVRRTTSGRAAFSSVQRGRSKDRCARAELSICMRAQVYPSTLSRFAFIADTPESGAIRISGRRCELARALFCRRTADLSRAEHHAGRRRARTVRRARLRSGASRARWRAARRRPAGAGLTVPFGQTQGGFDWVYPFGQPDSGVRQIH